MVSGGFSNLAYYLQQYGVLDFLLPFILVFTIIFSVTSAVPVLNKKKQFRVIVALTLALLFVVPHIVGYYPLGYDPVAVMNATLPSISLVAVAAVMLMLLMGLFGTEFTGEAKPWIALVALAFVGYIFGAALGFWTGPYDAFSWWSPQITELMLILLVFGLIIYFITKEDTSDGGIGKIFEGLEKGIGKYFKKQ
tara:strand:- start:3889 stop:4470 length:582 start_codon:yes stop_codon:yes gene_type:complete